VRLTACKFVSNDGLAPLAALPNLETLDVSWSQVRVRVRVKVRARVRARARVGV